MGTQRGGVRPEGECHPQMMRPERIAADYTRMTEKTGGFAKVWQNRPRRAEGRGYFFPPDEEESAAGAAGFFL